MRPLEIQVPDTLYYETYDDLDRFVSYYHQIDAVRKLGVKKVLEIGIGNKTVTNYLKQHGYDVVTCDFDANLRPDHSADIRKLPFGDGSFDAAVAFEILEHLPFEEVPKALEELSRVSKRYILISVPYSSAASEFFLNLRLPGFSRKWHWAVRIPYFFVRAGIRGRNKEHYWEIGRKGFSKKKVRAVLKRYFNVESEYTPRFDAFHRFFTLTKKHGNTLHDAQ